MEATYFHSAALVESNEIGPGTRVWAFAHVMRGSRIGGRCNIGDHAFIEAGAVIGNNVTIKNNVCVWMGVTLEDDVFVGPNVTFTNDRHPRSPRMPQAAPRYENVDGWLLPTVVERGVSIGANATVLPGIRLGRYSMIGAGAVVTCDVPPFALMIGTPARMAGHVCRCGYRLVESYLTATCVACGEKPDARLNLSEQEAVAL